MNRLADAAWAVNSKGYKRNQGLQIAKDILFPPATVAQIRAKAERVGELPPDFKEMVRVSNGYVWRSSLAILDSEYRILGRFKRDRHFLAAGIEGICFPKPQKTTLGFRFQP